MREQDGMSKGSCFIKYSLRESALLAIKNLHAQAYILNSDVPLEVRFAENKKKQNTAHNNSNSNSNSSTAMQQNQTHQPNNLQTAAAVQRSIPHQIPVSLRFSNCIIVRKKKMFYITSI